AAELGRGAPGAARDLFALARESASEAALEAEASTGEAEALSQLGDFASARPLFARALAVGADPDVRARATVGLARALAPRGELSAARAALGEAQGGAARAARAWIEALAGDLDLARQLGRGLPARGGPRAFRDAAADRSEALLAAGEPEAALEAAREAHE